MVVFPAVDMRVMVNEFHLCERQARGEGGASQHVEVWGRWPDRRDEPRRQPP